MSRIAEQTEPRAPRAIGVIPTKEQREWLERRKKRTGVGFSNTLKILLDKAIEEEAEKERAN